MNKSRGGKWNFSLERLEAQHRKLETEYFGLENETLFVKTIRDFEILKKELEPSHDKIRHNAKKNGNSALLAKQPARKI